MRWTPTSAAWEMGVSRLRSTMILRMMPRWILNTLLTFRASGNAEATLASARSHPGLDLDCHRCHENGVTKEPQIPKRWTTPRLNRDYRVQTPPAPRRWLARASSFRSRKILNCHQPQRGAFSVTMSMTPTPQLSTSKRQMLREGVKIMKQKRPHRCCHPSWLNSLFISRMYRFNLPCSRQPLLNRLPLPITSLRCRPTRPFILLNTQAYRLRHCLRNRPYHLSTANAASVSFSRHPTSRPC